MSPFPWKKSFVEFVLALEVELEVACRPMKERIVLKFGGAAVADVEGIKRVAEIVQHYLHEKPERQVVVVVSAMGKTTNKLESVMHLKFAATWKDLASIAHERLLSEHLSKAHALGISEGKIFTRFYKHLQNTLEGMPKINLQNNDLVLSCGELISTAIMHEYLFSLGIKSHWADGRELVRTNSKFSKAKLKWKKTRKQFEQLSAEPEVVVIQGFIGADKHGNTTTLGREGSDFTAAIVATCLPNVERVVLWKDVKGIYSEDPKANPDAQLFQQISYENAKQLIGRAKVVHEKTIDPLQNKGIPLQVRSFKPEYFGEKGTLIGNTSTD